MSGKPGFPDSDINRWINAQSIGLLAATLLAVFSRSAAPVAGVAVVMFALLFLNGRGTATKGVAGYLANCLTGLRLALVLVVAVAMDSLSAPAVFAMFTLNVVLDVVDGSVARWFGSESYRGAVFDQEVDAFFVLVACLYFYIVAAIGAWILLPGLLRYTYRLAAWCRGEASKNEQRQVVAVFLAGMNFVTLTVAVILPGNWQLVVLSVSTGLFAVSFGLSFWRIFATGQA